MLKKFLLCLGLFLFIFNLVSLNEVYAKNYFNGFELIDGNLYYFKDEKKVFGLINVENTYYYANNEGIVKICDGEMKIDGKYYYFSSPGYMDKGFVSRNGHLYYYDDDGVRVHGYRIIDNKYYYFNDKTGELTTNIGIDVSKHQGKINWEKVKSSNIKFAIIRSSYGFFTQDTYFERNFKECQRLNIPFGIYHYSYATNMKQAKEEVDGLLKLLKKYNIKTTYPIYIDMEDADGWKEENGNPSNKMYQQICQYFCDRLIDNGYLPGIYANYHWWTTKLNSNKLDKYEKWVANYGKNDGNMRDGGSGYLYKHGVWQYTSKGKIPGIKGSVDMNLGYIDYSNY